MLENVRAKRFPCSGAPPPLVRVSRSCIFSGNLLAKESSSQSPVGDTTDGMGWDTKAQLNAGGVVETGRRVEAVSLD